MSPRNFARVFARETGSTPADFVEAARIDAARRQLEDSSLAVVQVARAAGFNTAEHMRRAFHRRLGASPFEYRARFQSPAAAVMERM
jgi:transcriptional regulator GlxA family with amidase domain